MPDKDTLQKLERTLDHEIVQAMLRFCDGCEAAKIDGCITAALALNVLLVRCYETAMIGGKDHTAIMRVLTTCLNLCGNEHAEKRKEASHASNPN